MTDWAVREAETQLEFGAEVPTSRLQDLVEADASRPCVQRGADPEDWFPVHETRERAQELCSGCPVRRLCEELGLRGPTERSGPADGIWGGTTTRDRQAERRRRARAAAVAVVASDGTAA